MTVIHQKTFILSDTLGTTDLCRIDFVEQQLEAGDFVEAEPCESRFILRPLDYK